MYTTRCPATPLTTKPGTAPRCGLPKSSRPRKCTTCATSSGSLRARSRTSTWTRTTSTARRAWCQAPGCRGTPILTTTMTRTKAHRSRRERMMMTTRRRDTSRTRGTCRGCRPRPRRCSTGCGAWTRRAPSGAAPSPCACASMRTSTFRGTTLATRTAPTSPSSRPTGRPRSRRRTRESATEARSRPSRRLRSSTRATLCSTTRTFRSSFARLDSTLLRWPSTRPRRRRRRRRLSKSRRSPPPPRTSPTTSSTSREPKTRLIWLNTAEHRSRWLGLCQGGESGFNLPRLSLERVSWLSKERVHAIARGADRGVNLSMQLEVT
mmetsp:Transcript_10098/g.25205  ORF Transcript_10098/g.25205 Transcript_10098/m.25205 type:complete len:322 (-) Transcript_10098:100-1065(-)